MLIPPDAQNLIKFQARRVYAFASEELRKRYTFKDLEQEGNIVYWHCMTNFGKRRVKRKGQQTPLKFYRNWFFGYFKASLLTHYNRIIQKHLTQKRDVRAWVMPIEDLNPNKHFYLDQNGLRVELRIDLEKARKIVSPKGVKLIDLILDMADGKRIVCNGDVSISSVGKKLRLNRYRTMQIIKEVRKALGR